MKPMMIEKLETYTVASRASAQTYTGTITLCNTIFVPGF